MQKSSAGQALDFPRWREKAVCEGFFWVSFHPTLYEAPTEPPHTKGKENAQTGEGACLQLSGELNSLLWLHASQAQDTLTP